MKFIFLALSTLILLLTFQNCEVPEELIDGVVKSNNPVFFDQAPKQIVFYQGFVSDYPEPIVDYLDDVITLDLDNQIISNHPLYPKKDLDNFNEVALADKDEVIKKILNVTVYKVNLTEDVYCTLIYRQPWLEIRTRSGENIRLYKEIDPCGSHYFVKQDSITLLEELEKSIKSQLAN